MSLISWLQSSDVKNWLIGKAAGAGKDWRQEEKGETEDEMVGCHHQLDGHEFEQALGVGDIQEAWHASVHGIAESDMTGQLKWTDIEEKINKFENRNLETV